MGATTTRLMSFAECEQLPDEVCRRHELRHGELVEVPPPVHKHGRLQYRIRRLLEARAPEGDVVEKEMPFRLMPDFEYWIADVAYMTRATWDRIDPKGYLDRAPELVVEVLSPSNTAAEMNDRKKTFLEHGCREFWLVDATNRQIDVSTPDGVTTTYRAGQAIPLPLLGGGTLSVDDIFNGLD
jgi:Uma2 family endonuclease